MLTSIPTMAKINARPKHYTAISLFSGCGGSSTGHKAAGMNVLYANEFIPAAQDTYELNHPSTYLDRRDVRKVQSKEILKIIGLKKGELDLMDFSPPCFTAGTLITTSTGLKTIESIQKNDLVLTHTLSFKPVVEPMARKYSGDLYTVTPYGALPLDCTPEHPYYTRRNASGKKRPQGQTLSNPEWVDAKDLSEGDFVALPENQLSEMYGWSGVDIAWKHRTTKQLITYKTVKTLPVDKKSFWWLVGRWLGDGWLRHYENEEGLSSQKKSRYNTIICCDRTDEDVELNEILTRVKVCGFKYSVRKHRTSYKISIRGKEICKFFLQFGRGAANKEIPGFVQSLPVPILKKFVQGYLSADGCKKSKQIGHYKFSTVSQKLAVGMTQCLHKAFGIGVSIHKREQHHTASIIEGRHVTCKPIYVAEFRLHSDTSKNMHIEIDGMIWVPIRKITMRKFKGMVYNFSVQDDESYVANSVCVHNCKSFSSAGARDKGWEKASHYSDGVHQRTDDLFSHSIRILRGLMPKVFVAENVPGLVHGRAKGMFLEILKDLQDSGYTVTARVLNAAYLNVPQARERLIFVGVRNDLVKKGFRPVHPEPVSNPISVRQALPHIHFIKNKKNGILTYVPADIPSPTIVASDGTNSETAGFSCGGFVETEDGERRKYTIKELKVISTFPRDFKFTGTYKQRFERIGRAVPPMMMYHVSRIICARILKPYYAQLNKDA